MPDPAAILIVDDKQENLFALRSLLGRTDAVLVSALSGEEALQRAVERPYALCLLDIDMPGMDGFEVARLLRSVEETKHIPIIFLTAAFKDQVHRLEGYDTGAVDYIEKPIEDQVLLSKVQVFLELYRQRSELETLKNQLEAKVEERTEQVRATNERLQTTLNIQQSTQRRLSTLISNLPGMVYRIERSRTGPFAYVSEGALELLGLSPDSLTTVETQGFARLIHPDDRHRTEALIARALTDRRPFEVVYRIKTETGVYRWVSERGRLVDEQFIEGLLIDVTAQIEAEEALERHRDELEQQVAERTAQLEQSRLQYSRLVENAEDLIFRFNLDPPRFDYINPAAERILGYESQVYYADPQWLVQRLFNADPNQLKIFANPTPRTIRQPLQIRVKHKEGRTVWLELHNVPLLDDQNRVVGIEGVARDITRLKEQEAELIQATSQAERANQLKSQFLANMSHEIRTPMNSILGFSNLALEQVQDEQAAAFLGQIVHSGEDLLELINDILDLSKIEAGMMEIEYAPFNLRELVEHLRSTCAPLAQEKGLELEVQVPDALPGQPSLDEKRLRQVLINLLSNAIKFTDQGKVEFKAQLRPTGEPNRADLILHVKDTGRGISSEELPLIFDSFYQSQQPERTSQEGTGLGLAISNQLVNLMHGTLTVSSVLDEGTAVTLHFPNLELHEHHLETSEAIPTLIERYRFLPANVLVVDDVESNRWLMKEILSRINLTGHFANDGREGVKLANELRPDLILMDLRMPKMDGYQAFKKLQANPHTAQIPILALTASVTPDAIARVKRFGFQGFVGKPVHMAHLIQQLAPFLQIEPLEKA